MRSSGSLPFIESSPIQIARCSTNAGLSSDLCHYKRSVTYNVCRYTVSFRTVWLRNCWPCMCFTSRSAVKSAKSTVWTPHTAQTFHFERSNAPVFTRAYIAQNAEHATWRLLMFDFFCWLQITQYLVNCVCHLCTCKKFVKTKIIPISSRAREVAKLSNFSDSSLRESTLNLLRSPILRFKSDRK